MSDGSESLDFDRQQAASRYRGTTFTPFVEEQLGYYVYLLSDPRNGEIFYVGKGLGNRVFAHTSDALDHDRADSDKLDRIRSIHAAGLEVRHELLRFGLTERAAFEVESAAIELLGLTELTNIVAGHHIGERGRMSTDEAISLFDAPRLETIHEPAVLIRIPNRWYPAMQAQDLYDATRGWWRLGPRHENATVAFAVSKGVIRAVYRIDRWRPREKGDLGWEEDPKPAGHDGGSKVPWPTTCPTTGTGAWPTGSSPEKPPRSST